MNTRTRVAAALAAATLSTATLGTATGSAAVPYEIKGGTTITARASAVVPVTLRRATRFDVGIGLVSDAFAVSGRGRVIGFALARAGDSPVVVSVMTFGNCSAPGCVAEAPFGQAELVGTRGVRRVNPAGEKVAIYELPAGRYTAHVFTDGAPVTVRLRLPGLTGRAAFSARTPHRAVLKSAPATLPVPVTGPAYSAGATAPVHGPLTLMAHHVRQTSEPHVEHVESNCYYRDSTPPGGHVLPTCPGGSQGYLFDIGVVTTRYRSLGYGTRLVEAEADSWYQGIWVEGVQGPSQFATTFFWSDLRT